MPEDRGGKLAEADVYAMKRRLRRKAARLYPGDEERQRRYVFGTLYHMGWRPAQEETGE